MKNKTLCILAAMLLMAVSGALAQSPYSVTIQNGTEDADEWTIAPSPANAGQTVTATYSGEKHVKSVKYVKKLRTPVVTAPTAKSLTYSGSALELVNAGSTTGGTMQYKVNDESYSANIPKATDAGTYTVYYKVVGGEAYSDVDEASVSVTINKAVAAAKSSKSSWAVGDVICGNGNAYTIDANHKLPSSVTPTAIVAYKGSDTGDAYYNTGGLAIGLTDASTGCKWKTSKGNKDNDNRSNNASTQIGYKESGRSITGTKSSGRGSSTTWPAFYNSVYDHYNKFYPSSATSGWFLPSLHQWNQIVKGLTGSSVNLTTSNQSALAISAVNAKITAAGFTGLANEPYWLASEVDNDQAWVYRAGGMAGYETKTSTHRVRPIIAF